MVKKGKHHKKKTSTKAKPHHNVYVIELDREVLTKKKFALANPDHKPERACLYVGMTGLMPAERFEVHKNGGRKSNKYVEVYGLHLRHRMFKRFNPMTYGDALKMEKKLADDLRAKGYAVWQH